MSIFEKQDKMAEDILTNYRGKVLKIVKATRVGATTSLLKSACELGQKTVIVAPYGKILELTVEDIKNLVDKRKPSIARYSANREICEKVKAKIRENSSLEQFPFHFRPPCRKCEFNDPSRCKLQEILSKDYDILGLTYARLRTDCTSESEIASAILGKLKRADNLVLDEFTTGMVSSAPSAPIEDPYSYLDNEFDLLKADLAKGISEVEATFREKIPEFVIYLNLEGEKLQEGQHAFCDNPLSEEDRSFFNNNFAKVWRLIERFAIEGKNTTLLRQIVQIVSAKRLLVERKGDKLKATPVEDLAERYLRGSDYLKSFLKDFAQGNKLVALVDACFPDLDLSAALGVSVDTYDWRDPLSTNRSQLIISDTHKFGEMKFLKDTELQSSLKLLINFAATIHKPHRVLIVTMNKRMHNVVKSWQSRGEIPKEIMTTYYRSEFSRGITIDPRHRLLVLIGGPYLRKTAYLAEAFGTDKQSAFKRSDMRSAFINLIGRVKDPKGQEKSVVFATGIKPDEIKAFVTQAGISSPWIVRFPFQGADSLDFETVAGIFLHPPIAIEDWKTLQQDLPILARIMNFTMRKKKRVTLSEIFRLKGENKFLQQLVTQHRSYLETLGFRVIAESRGLSFEESKTTK